nr:ATP-binding cassette domain-containing protein [Veillonella denticariosi]
MRIGKQFRELFKAHIDITDDECDRRAIELLASVSLPDGGADMLKRYPHELSGGQRQRVGIAMALALDPALLIGDEPTSALDVTTQSQVVMQMLELSKEHNSAIVMVTHNLGVAAYMSDYILVMKKGRVVDAGTPQDILENPSNAYTKQLKDAVPTLGGGRYID